MRANLFFEFLGGTMMAVAAGRFAPIAQAAEDPVLLCAAIGLLSLAAVAAGIACCSLAALIRGAK